MRKRFFSSAKVFSAIPAERVIAAAREFTSDLVASHPEVVGVYLVGSYARGDHGVSSDADFLIVVNGTTIPFLDRPLTYGPKDFVVATDTLVYTVREWEDGGCRQRWSASLASGLTLYERSPGGPVGSAPEIAQVRDDPNNDSEAIQ